MWGILLGLSLTLIFFATIMVLLYKKYLKFDLDTAEARRSLFPVSNSKRSHPAPQYFWHPELKVTKQQNGLFDGVSIEQNLCAQRGYYTTKDKDEGVKIFWQSYRPKRIEVVTHAMVMLHGYGNHCDFTNRQIAITHAKLNNSWVFTFDYPGHGRSDGLWGFIGDWAILIEQIVELVDNFFLPQVRELHKPVFCWGASQGGAVAIHVCMSYPNLFSGAVLLCPMCDIADEVGPPACAISCLVCMSRIVGWLPIVPSKDHSTFAVEDPKVLECHKYGPNRNKLKYNKRPRLATGRELLGATLEIISRCATEMTTPFLIIHGDNDNVCPIEQSRKFYSMANVEDKVFEEISGGWHAIIQKDTVRIYQLMFEWVNKRLHLSQSI